MAWIGLALDGIGVLIVAAGAIVALYHALEDLGRAVLIGLQTLQLEVGAGWPWQRGPKTAGP